jgi:hypothetical protein
LGWSRDELRSHLGGVPLSRDVPFGAFLDIAEGLREAGEERLYEGKVAYGMIAGDYIYGLDLPPEARSLFPPPSFATLWADTRQLFVGAGASDPSTPRTFTHRDALQTLLCHAWGEKRVVLYSPDQAPCLYPYDYYTAYQPVWAKPWAPNYERYPLLRGLRPIECTLRPGEVLFIPFGWFHEVYTNEMTMSVSMALDFDAFPPPR